jgi:hypothetical protein
MTAVPLCAEARHESPRLRTAMERREPAPGSPRERGNRGPAVQPRTRSTQRTQRDHEHDGYFTRSETGALQSPGPPLGVIARYRNVAVDPDTSPTMLVLAWMVGGMPSQVQAPNTMQAKTTVLGLPVATVVEFLFRTTTNAGQGDWSLPTSILVK